MKYQLLAVAMLAVASWTTPVSAWELGVEAQSYEGYGAPAGQPSYVPWHAGYYNAYWGAPVPLVVPPTAQYQTHWSWGVPSARMSTIDPQFGGPYWGYSYEGTETWQPAPYWPTSTDQMGVYYIRGPW